MQLDDRAAADAFVAEEPMNKAGVYAARRNPPLVEQLRQARGRLSPQGHAAVPVHGAEDRHATSSSASTCTRTSATSRRMATASSSAGRSARPMAPTTSAPRCCSNCRTGRRRTSSGTRSRLPRTAGISGTRGSCGGCSGIDWCWIDGRRLDGRVATLTEMAGTSPAITQEDGCAGQSPRMTKERPRCLTAPCCSPSPHPSAHRPRCRAGGISPTSPPCQPAGR